MSLSVVLTCYHEVPLVFESYDVLSRLMGASGIEHEFIVVDDGSTSEVQNALREHFDPSTVVGTSKGTMYTVVAATTHGVVARREAHLKNTRIRVAGKPGQSLPDKHINPKYIVINENGAGWETYSQNSHLAHNGHGPEQLRALVANGLRLLLDAESKGWN